MASHQVVPSVSDRKQVGPCFALKALRHLEAKGAKSILLTSPGLRKNTSIVQIISKMEIALLASRCLIFPSPKYQQILKGKYSEFFNVPQSYKTKIPLVFKSTSLQNADIFQKIISNDHDTQINVPQYWEKNFSAKFVSEWFLLSYVDLRMKIV